jgi:hypothetical protein
MWRCGPLETDAAQHYQAVGERLVPERTAQASGNAVVLQDPQRLVRIERHIAVVLVAAPPKAGSFAAEHRDRAVETSALWLWRRADTARVRPQNARLGADVVRYTFIVSDFHRLLLAGLPAHFESDHPSHTVGLGGVTIRNSSRD